MLDYGPPERFLVTADADMALGRRKAEQQSEFWVPSADLPQSPGHPFYEQLKQVLAAAVRRGGSTGSGRSVAGSSSPRSWAGRRCRRACTSARRGGLLVGYPGAPGLPSERQIAWRCADSLSLRAFLGLAPKESSPDDSSLNRTRLRSSHGSRQAPACLPSQGLALPGRIDLETHPAVFDWVLKRLAEHELLKGRTLGVDGSTLEANAAMRAIVRRETGQSYREFLTDLAKASGIETPPTEDLVRRGGFDRQRKGKKCSNKDWFNPHDPDAKVAKMKDGTTHLAHKNEHAVDLETGAIVAPAVHPADEGDTTTMWGTLEQACTSLQEVREDDTVQADTSDLHVKEVVVDKGYHPGRASPWLGRHAGA